MPVWSYHQQLKCCCVFPSASPQFLTVWVSTVVYGPGEDFIMPGADSSGEVITLPFKEGDVGDAWGRQQWRGEGGGVEVQLLPQLPLLFSRPCKSLCTPSPCHCCLAQAWPSLLKH